MTKQMGCPVNVYYLRDSMPELMDTPELLASIILPTYNEKGNIEKLIPALSAVLPWPVEFIVVDDNSPDGTAQAIREIIPTVANIRLIVRTEERGLVSAIQRGIDESQGRIVVWMDCDFSLPPTTVPQLITHVLDHNADAAIGSRYIPGGADELYGHKGPIVVIQKCATHGLNWLTTLLMQTHFHDWTSGFIAIRSEVIKGIPLHGDYGEYFIMLMAELIRDNYRWVEVPYQNIPRTIGQSKTAETFLGLMGRGSQYLRHIFKARALKNSAPSRRTRP
ncbi:MAG: glycosyltransferase [Proteobacteria bacterium]|nr:glycosyltransferase [Pseudomonadota bacterium]MDP2107226.1 glycosyltransferase [Desulfobulbaceae bacterium]